MLRQQGFKPDRPGFGAIIPCRDRKRFSKTSHTWVRKDVKTVILERKVQAVTRLVVFAIIVLIVTIACGGGGGGAGGGGRIGGGADADKPPITPEPSREDIIQAVRRSVEGKTYTENVSQQEPTTRMCSEMDVETDPYMPRNPELAKCPRVGAPYTTWQTVTKPEVRECKSLPGPESGWNVQALPPDRWRVSRGASVWDVEKTSGRRVEKAVTVSSFTFAITPHQNC